MRIIPAKFGQNPACSKGDAFEEIVDYGQRMPDIQ